MGFQSPTSQVPYYHSTPYGQFLQKWLGEQGTVLVRGVNGEFTGEMVRRFARDVLQAEPRYVIILGGTNDLGANIPPSQIFRNLVNLYDQAQAAFINPVAVTVPSLRVTDEIQEAEFLRTHVAWRVELNHSIQDYCRTSNIPCVDLFSNTIEEESSMLLAQYSNDGVHLSTQGYELLGQLLWDRVWVNEYGARP